jgi:hypothetical protein
MLLYFTAIWSILQPFGTFFPFWYLVLRKIWQPWRGKNVRLRSKHFVFVLPGREKIATEGLAAFFGSHVNNAHF